MIRLDFASGYKIPQLFMNENMGAPFSGQIAPKQTAALLFWGKLPPKRRYANYPCMYSPLMDRAQKVEPNHGKVPSVRKLHQNKTEIGLKKDTTPKFCTFVRRYPW
jgi:hypothetical protein